MKKNRIRIAFGLGLIVILLIGTLYFLSQRILGDTYLALEDQQVRQNVGRALDALNNNLEALNSKTGDWANWDDAYNFAQDGNADFIRVNINEISSKQLEINFIVFLQPSGRIQIARAYDLKTQKEVPFPASLAQLFSDKKSLEFILQNNVSSPGLTGLVLTPENPVLIAARPILTSESTGPIRGTLIFARYLDDAGIARLAATTHLALAAQRLDQTALTDSFPIAQTSLSTKNPIYTHIDDPQTIHGYGLLNDIFGKPALALRVESPRDIYQQGQTTIRFLTLRSLLAALIFAGIAQLLIERIMVSQRSHRESEARYRAVVERAAEGIVLVDADTTRVLEANPAFQKIFGYSANEISNVNLQELVADSGNAAAPETLGFKLLVGERRYQRKDGTQLDVEANASLISQNSHSVVSVILRDVTVRNQRQREIQLRAKELGALYDTVHDLAELHDLPTLLQTIIDRAAALLSTPSGGIYLYDAFNGDFVLTANRGPVRTVGTRLQRGEGIVSRVAETRQPVIVDDYRRSPYRAAKYQNLPITSMIQVPMIYDGELIGTLAVNELAPATRQFTEADARLLTLFAAQAASAVHNTRLFEELENSYLQTVLALARTVDAKDNYTADHSDRLAKMAIAVGQELGMKGRELEDLHYGAILHDIGKIGIADSILKKPARLTEAEWAEMRKHPEIGGQILAPVPRLAGAAKIVRHHHERFDGKGYPDKLIGEAIPLGARILTVVDSYSAIVDERVYKKGRSQAEAVAELVRCTGTQFDARVVQILLEMLARGDISAATLQNEPILATAPILADLRLLVDD